MATMKDFAEQILAVFILVFVGLLFIALQEIDVSINGVACNFSSDRIWLTVTETDVQKAYLLRQGSCTNPFAQDVEAIWGRDCNNDPCRYQAWKLGAGLFEVYNDSDSHSGFTLRIRGWGAGSRWHITEDWPKPELSTISYSLVR